MGADDAWSAEIKRLPFTPHPDPLALDDDLAERLLDGDLPLDQTPPGYAEVAALRRRRSPSARPADWPSCGRDPGPSGHSWGAAGRVGVGA